jgi:hypothetical protein
VYVLLTIIDAVKDIETNPACKIIICERSLSASRYVFADMHAENVFDTTDIYCRLYEEISTNYSGSNRLSVVSAGRG